jgi:dGTPase
MTWLRREDLEDLELHRLARYAAFSRDHGGRRHAEDEDPLRTAFQRDRDRIIHSPSFRRLQHKTQVFAAHTGDHYRTRMTHSLEVSQMARNAALALRLNPDLAEAIALAHDLGHPPFGHVGEAALDELMQHEGGFRHNAQGSRITDVLEARDDSGHGLNLTLALRRSLLKGRIPDGFPLSADLLPKAAPPLEAVLVDHCDKIAYLCHDLDDAIRAGLVSADDAVDLELWRLSVEHLAALGRQPRISRINSKMVALLVRDLVQASDAALTDRPGRPLLQHSDAMRVASNELLAFLRDRFYHSAEILDEMAHGQDKIRACFAHLVQHPGEIPANMRDRAGDCSTQRLVCDYVAGMTDRYLLGFGLA